MQFKYLAALLVTATLQGALAAPVFEANNDGVQARAEQAGQAHHAGQVLPGPFFPGNFDPDLIDILKRDQQDWKLGVNVDEAGTWDARREAEAGDELQARAEQAKQGEQYWWPGSYNQYSRFNNPASYYRGYGYNQFNRFNNPGFYNRRLGFNQYNNPYTYGGRGWW